MPVSPQRRPGADAPPDRLRPYAFHGVHLTVQGPQAVGDCPLCGREGKFTVHVGTGLWRCFVCGVGTERGGGNPLVLLRCLHAAYAAATPPEELHRIAQDRRLAVPGTVAAWGGCVDSGRAWAIPGYGPGGTLDQLYRRVWLDGGRCLLPTPGVWPEGRVHALHLPANDFDPARPNVWVAEGPWDGMALWEAGASADTNVVAVPGCNVWRDEWSELCRGKHVTLWYDSDHPVPEALRQGRTVRPGLDGMCRVARRLSGIAASVRFVRWGREGYDPSRPSGWDVRDHLAQGADLEGRRTLLAELLARVESAPADWFTPHTSNGAAPGTNGHAANVEPEPCDSWAACEAAWRDALEWRAELGDVLSVMLAVAASVQQAGDNQLFLRVIGDPGSAKTRMCKGLLVSRRCKLLLHLKSFHSGFKKPGEDDKDCSLVARINGLCLVTPEADALEVGMNTTELDRQVRQIFDGDSGNTYGNSDVDRQYKGLRCPWIQAGTPALMDKDQSRLGDRFLRIRIEEPSQATKRAIMMRSLRNERLAVLETANGTESSIISPRLRRAYALTGGYVDWLRAHVEERLAAVGMDGAAEERCVDLAELTADMRARPNMDPKKHEVHHTKELGSRLAGQFGRLALCLAVVRNKQSVDADVLRVVRKVALDTAHGHTLNIVQWLCAANPKVPGKNYQECGGLMDGTLEMWTGMTKERLANYLGFLRKVGVLEWREQRQSNGSWLLTGRVYDLYLRVMGG